VLGKPPEEITADERSMAKMVNFGLAYGMSDFGLSSRAGISRQEAQEFINSYFAAYSGISYYMLHIKDTARRQGFVTTLLGRKRPIPELHAGQRGARGAGERMAINMPIQGTRRGHREDRDDPARRRSRPRAASAPGCSSRSTTSSCSRCRSDEVDRLMPGASRNDGGRAAAVGAAHRSDVKVGTDWESMTPVTRQDAAPRRGRRGSRRCRGRRVSVIASGRLTSGS
jgi:hypothetical protein